MAASFPTSLDALTNPTASDTTNSATVPHATQHANLNDIAEALEAKVGITASTPAVATALIGNAAGSSVWTSVDALTLMNPILNATYNIWQDATSFTSIADATWGPDGWIYNKVGAVVHDLLRSTDVPSVAANAALGNYSLQLDVTTVDSSIAAGDYCTIATRIEGYNWLPFAQRQVTLSFWVKAAKTGTHCVYFRNSGTSDRTYVAEYTISVADTWEYKTITVTASPSAGTWDYTTGRGIEIGWALSCGSTFQTTAGAWQTGNFRGTSNQVNETDNTANNFRLYGAHLALGAYGVPCAPAPYAFEEYRCKRYNEVKGNGVQNSVFGTGGCISTTQADFHIPVVPKRAGSPSYGALSGTIGDLAVIEDGGSVQSLTALTDLSGSPDGTGFIRVTVGTGLTAKTPAKLYAPTTGKLRIQSRIP